MPPDVKSQGMFYEMRVGEYAPGFALCAFYPKTGFHFSQRALGNSQQFVRLQA